MLLLAASILAPSLGVSVPLRRDGDFYCVPVTVGGGEPHWYDLDTGCSDTLLTEKGLDRLTKAGVKPGKDGSLSVSHVAIGGVPVGDLKMKRDTEDFKSSIDADMDGQIGIDALANFRVALDLAKGEMRLWPKSVPLTAARREWFGAGDSKVASTGLYRLMSDTYQAYVLLNGVPLLLDFDTGSDGTCLYKSCRSMVGGGYGPGGRTASFTMATAWYRSSRRAGSGLEGVGCRARWCTRSRTLTSTRGSSAAT